MPRESSRLPAFEENSFWTSLIISCRRAASGVSAGSSAAGGAVMAATSIAGGDISVSGSGAGVTGPAGSNSQGVAAAIASGDSSSSGSSNDWTPPPCFSFSANSWYRQLLFDGRGSLVTFLRRP